MVCRVVLCGGGGGGGGSSGFTNGHSLHGGALGGDLLDQKSQLYCLCLNQV